MWERTITVGSAGEFGAKCGGETVEPRDFALDLARREAGNSVIAFKSSYKYLYKIKKLVVISLRRSADQERCLNALIALHYGFLIHRR